MKTLYLKKPAPPMIERGKLILNIGLALVFFIGITPAFSLSAQAVLFDFDNIPVYTPLPVSPTVGGITAHLSATGQGYSIQDANVHGFTPQGFSGHIIDPSSINLSDLLISFDQPLTDFSIMYSPQELACDTSATMRVTAYMHGNYVGTNTKIASVPGTWPVDTLRCSFMQGFDSVVVHYDSHPPTCQDYGVIFMADNMRVTAFNITGIQEPLNLIERLIVPNPVSHTAIISFSMLQSGKISVNFYDITGRLVRTIYEGRLDAGEHQLNWEVNESVTSGMYLLNLSGENFTSSCKLVVAK